MADDDAEAGRERRRSHPAGGPALAGSLPDAVHEARHDDDDHGRGRRHRRRLPRPPLLRPPVADVLAGRHGRPSAAHVVTPASVRPSVRRRNRLVIRARYDDSFSAADNYVYVFGDGAVS